MRRIVIFVLLFPLMAFLVVIATSLFDGKSPANFADFRFGLEVAYIFGLLPALLCCALDWFLRSNPYRITRTTALGAVISTPLWILFASPRLGWFLIVVSGICLGAIPAAICSWLSGEKPKEETT
jgi:hypothetical protein